jgi:hypothetical protein
MQIRAWREIVIQVLLGETMRGFRGRGTYVVQYPRFGFRHEQLAGGVEATVVVTFGNPFW